MGRFLDGVKRVCPNDTPDQIEEALEDLLTRKIRSVDLRTISPVAAVPLKVFQLFQIGLWRSTELAEAALGELNREHVSSSHVLVRAVYETCALMLETIRRVEELVSSNDPTQVDDLDKFLRNVLLGSKSKEWSFSEEYAARNVLTIIQKLTKETGLNLIGFYETLSERAHPNYLGMLAVYQHIDDPLSPIVHFQDSDPESHGPSLNSALGGLLMGLQMLQLALDHYDVARTRLAMLCERELFESSKWPSGVEYPVRRD